MVFSSLDGQKSSILLQEVISDLKQGKIVCISDNEDIENEIDMMCLAEYATPSNINYMAHEACGFICCVLPHDICIDKGLDYLKQEGLNIDHRGTPFCAFLDHKDCDTGISAYERSKTIKELACTDKDISHFVQGHTPVLHSKKGLLSERLGHTEMSSQLSFMCDSNGSAVICEILNYNGDMLRVCDFDSWNKDKGLKLYTMKQLIESFEI